MEGIEEGQGGQSGDGRGTRGTEIARVTVLSTLQVGQTKKINPERRTSPPIRLKALVHTPSLGRTIGLDYDRTLAVLYNSDLTWDSPFPPVVL